MDYLTTESTAAKTVSLLKKPELAQTFILALSGSDPELLRKSRKDDK